MEGVHPIKYLLQENDFMIKVDLKGAYLHTSLHKDTGKFIRFLLGRKFVQIALSVLWPRNSSSDFHKAAKYPNSSVKVNHESKIFKSYSGTGNFLLQNLGFVISLRKSHLTSRSGFLV